MESDERGQVEEDTGEDLELDERQADDVRGGFLKIKIDSVDNKLDKA